MSHRQLEQLARFQHSLVQRQNGRCAMILGEREVHGVAGARRRGETQDELPGKIVIRSLG